MYIIKRKLVGFIVNNYFCAPNIKFGFTIIIIVPNSLFIVTGVVVPVTNLIEYDISNREFVTV